MRNNSEAFLLFQELSNDPELIIKLDKAAGNPTTEESRELIRKLTSGLRVFTPLIPFSHAARRSKLGDFVAHVRHFGRPLFFNTLSPDPLGNLGAIRRTFASLSNLTFPAFAEPFSNALRDELPLTHATRGPRGAVEAVTATNSKVKSGFRLLKELKVQGMCDRIMTPSQAVHPQFRFA